MQWLENVLLNKKELVRLGSIDDGGYVLPIKDIKSSNVLISFGISDNWDFEKDFIKISNAKVIAYDHSIDSNFWISKFKKDLIKFIKLKIFKPKKLYKMRDFETHDQHIKMAQISRTKSYLGVKGIAKVSELLQNIPLSAPIDYMHQVLIGVNKVMLQLIIRRPKKEVIEIDEMVKAFKVIISLINKEFYIWIKIPPFVLKLFFNFFQ